MKTISLITCENLTEAHLIKGRLKNEGIDCILTNQNFTNLMPHYSNMNGFGIQVMISETDISKARQIIKDILEPENAPVKCPHCGSTEVGLGLGKFSGIKIINSFIASFLMSFPFGNLKPKYYCKRCNSDIS